MAWLEHNRPVRSQFRRGRRQKLRPIVVVHTAENPWPNSNALNVANFIRTRTDPGSYHRLVDASRIIPLVDLDNEAFQDGTGSNPWAMGLSAACRTVDWTRMDTATLLAFVNNLAHAAAEMNAHSIRRGAGCIQGRRISKAQSDAGVSGFVTHGDRDPRRRTDPGVNFPWNSFLARYNQLTSQNPPSSTPPSKPAPSGGFLMSLTPSQQNEILGRIRATDMRMVEQQERMAEALGRIRATDLRMVQQQERMTEAEARIRATDLRMVQQQERMAEAMERLASIEAAVAASIEDAAAE